MALVTFVTNLNTRQAHAQDIGQNSLLFALSTEQRAEVIEETVVPENFVKDSHYLSSSSMLYVPNIDFDYSSEEDTLPATSIAVPGTIAATPIHDGTQTSKAKRTKTETYIVKENDTISSISQQFGVNIGTILWNNALKEKQYIRPGDSLRIPPVSGMLVTVKKGDTISKIAEKYQSNESDILAYNNVSDVLTLGSELIVPGGSPPAPVQERIIIAVRRDSPVSSNIRTKPSSIVGTTAPSDQLNTSIGTVVDAEVGNTEKPDDVISDNFPKTRLLWPTSGHVITQYYGWRHTGLDIDGDFSSPIYASEDGVVEKAGWNSGGYGLMILIQHSNGLVTRYAHASKMFVKAGDTVHKGEVIAMVGTTGRSTGTHLHYEVYVNGKRTNPLAYIK